MKTKYFIKTFEFHDTNEMNNKLEKVLDETCRKKKCKLVQIISQKESTMAAIDCAMMECWYPWYVSCLFERIEEDAIEISQNRFIKRTKKPNK